MDMVSLTAKEKVVLPIIIESPEIQNAKDEDLISNESGENHLQLDKECHKPH